MTRFLGIIYGSISYICKRKTFYTILALGVIFVLISGCFYSPGSITINQRTLELSELINMIRAINLSLSIFWGMIFAILMGMSSATSEVDSKQIYLVLSKPITRSQYILSRMLSALTISFSIIFVMTLLSWIIYNLRLGVFDLRLWIGVGIVILELALIISFVTLLSLFMPRIIAGFIGIIAYLFSFILSIDVIKTLVLSSEIPLHTRIIARIIYIIIPPFMSITNLAIDLMNKLPILKHELLCLIHALCYLLISLCFIILLFRRKEF
ncbi:MAG: ABC transporter permease [bacterium]